jgi:hypothetical protein
MLDATPKVTAHDSRFSRIRNLSMGKCMAVTAAAVAVVFVLYFAFSSL